MSNPIDDRPQTRSAGILLEIFSEMVHREADFALLCGGDADPLDTSSDIDLVLAKDPREVIDPILMHMQALGKILVVQRLHYEVPYGYYYVVKVKIPDSSAEFLHLDCLHDPWGIGRYHLNSAFLLKDREAQAWGWRANRRREALYLLIKRAIKGEVTSEGIRALEQAFSDGRPNFWSEVERWFGPKSKALVDRLFAAQDRQECSVALSGLRRTLERRFRFRHPLRYIVGWSLSILRQWRRFLQPTGLFVVVLGPDGSGKSTVSGLVLRNLERAFRRAWRFHWRPGLFRKLGRTANRHATGTDTPAETSKYHGFVSLARFIYYWLDFVIGYWVVIYPVMARTGLVIGERYFPDVLVAPERYGFAVPRWLMRSVAWFVPRPDLIVLLKDDPDVIHARKPELSPARIGELMDAYEMELKHWGNARILTTEGGAAVVAARLAAIILEERAAKTARQIGWTP